ncbi:MAG TPA: DUF4321 domain-containing protein [Clostridia bacterium]|nr:DUF4321 domain-containing protein [Clostridia bacterium]
MRIRTRNPWVLVLLLITGAVIGSFFGQYLSQFFPFLRSSYPIGIKEPLFLDLGFLSLVLGFVININIASVLGLIIAMLVFIRI